MNRRTEREKAMKMLAGTRMGRRLVGLGALLGLVALCGLSLGASPAPAAVGAVPVVKAGWSNTDLPPGGEGLVSVQVRNVGDADFGAGLTITDQLPPGVRATKIEWERTVFDICEYRIHNWAACEAYFGVAPTCTGVGTETVTCELSPLDVNGEEFGIRLGRAPGVGSEFNYNPRPSGYLPPIDIEVAVDAGASGSGLNTVTVDGGGVSQPASDIDEVPFNPQPRGFGLVPGSFEADVFGEAYPFGERSRRAGDHPFEERVNFEVNSGFTEVFGKNTRLPSALVRAVEVTLPRGLVGNPETLPKCDPADFAELGASFNGTTCPSNTQVGYINIPLGAPGWGRNIQLSRVPIYNLEPPRGTPVDLAFNAGGLVLAHIYATLDPAQNYAIKSLSPNISAFIPPLGAEVTLWGVPGDPAHDKFRFYPKAIKTGEFDEEGEEIVRIAGAPFTAPIRPFFTNPSDCGFDNGGHRIRIESYAEPNQFTPREEDSHALNVSDCDDPRFRFEPDVTLQPTTRAAGASTGLRADLKVPQRDEEVEDAAELYAENGDVQGISTPPVKKVVTTLPLGMTINPAAAQGLASCSPEQIGLGTNAPVTCPDASQYGTLTLHTPVLPINAQPEGWIYIAKQNDNPFHNFLSLYLVIQEPERGILIKIPGRVDLDPVTGQITTTFDDLPQFPMSDMELNLKGGLRAGLVNPKTCGTKTITATFYSWQDPQTPHTVTNNYEITQNPDGSPCLNSLSDRPFNPDLSGGTRNNLAGSFSPLQIHMTRSDEDQELSGVEGTAPPGLLASLKGVGRCSDAAIAAAAVDGRTGAEENANPSCPASSLVGTVDAGTGVGQILTYVKGKVYLAGPYKGAPLSGVAIVPAVAGPFDLGVIVTRAPAFVNPKTAQVSLKTDPLPLIFKGVPVRVRDIQVNMDRDHFTLNPTNCEPFALRGTLFSSEGKAKQDGSPFQAADCASLGFHPRLFTRLFGGTKRGAHPKFRGVYKPREGDANAAAAVVTLPRSEFLDQGHIRTVCTRVQFAAGGGNGERCPAGAVYGHVVAHTPLLEEKLTGPVFLRSSNHKLPDLVAVLHGIITVEVSARIDSIRGGIRTHFESIPDAPVSSFVITMQGGKKGLLVNSRNICKRRYRIHGGLTGQNGKEATLHPKLNAKCGRSHRKGHRHHRHAKRASVSVARAGG